MMSLAEGLFLLILLIFLIKGFIRGAAKESLGVLVSLLALTLPGISFIPLSLGKSFKRWDETEILPVMFISLAALILILGPVIAGIIRSSTNADRNKLSIASRIAGGAAAVIQGMIFLVILTIFFHMQNFFSLDNIFFSPNRFTDFILYWVPVG